MRALLLAVILSSSFVLTGCPEIYNVVRFDGVQGRLLQNGTESTHFDASAHGKVGTEVSIGISGDICYGENVPHGAHALFDFTKIPALDIIEMLAGVNLTKVTIEDKDHEGCLEVGAKVRAAADLQESEAKLEP